MSIPMPEPYKMDDLPERPSKRQKSNGQVLKTGGADFVENNLEYASESSDGFTKHQRVKEKFNKAQKLSERRKQQHGETEDEREVSKPQSSSVKQRGLEPLPQPEDKETPTATLKTPLPQWLANPMRVATDALPIDMSTLSLSKGIHKNLVKQGYSKAFAIQAAVIPLLLPGGAYHHGDVCVSASTGSGKTLSYILPMIEALRNKSVRLLRGLIVVPTRELVNQVRATLEICAAGTDIKIGIAVGNRTLAEDRRHLLERRLRYDMARYTDRQRKQRTPTIEELMDWETDSEDEYEVPPGFVADLASAVDILVCTPGRLVDHVRSTRGFSLHNVQWMVIDEADKLLDQSFQQWIDTVMPELKFLPKHDEMEESLRQFLRVPQQRFVQKVILSATMTQDISKLLSLELKNPKLVVLDGQQNLVNEDQPTLFELPTNLHETAITLGRNIEKPLALLQLLDELLQTETYGSGANNAMTRHKTSDRSKGIPSNDGGVSSTSSENDTSSSGSDSDSDPDSSSDSDSDPTSDSESDGQPSNIKHSPPVHSQERLRGVLIFANTNEAAQRLSRLLGLLRPEWQQKIGTLTKSTASSSGRRLLASFHSGKLSIIVASDRASRGLDIKDLAFVVNYDMPASITSYVHRVGRTARAGGKGNAYTIVSHHEGRWFWKEIGKSDRVRREAKLARKADMGRDVSEGLQRSYEKALKKLGEEARGE